jgi:predicted membrane protein
MPVMYVVVTLIFVGIAAWLVNAYVPMVENIKTIVNVVLALIVVGIALWLINTYIPMAGSIKAILNLVVVVATCVAILQAVGLWSGTVGLWRKITSHRFSAPDKAEVPEPAVPTATRT